MLSEQDWRRNVGTEAYPVSFLHEYAVALIYDQLILGREVQLPLLNGELSSNVMEGVGHINFPDSLQAIGGYVPDIALYDSSFRVLRVIEVVVTKDVPSDKLRSLESRGVEVLQVPVRSESDLRALYPPSDNVKPWWWPEYHQGLRAFPKAQEILGVNWLFPPHHQPSSSQLHADHEIKQLMGNLSRCSPEVRRAFVAWLKDIESLDSLYPIQRDNPKRDVLDLHRK